MIILYLDSKTHAITDEADEPISLEQAKQIVADGRLEDCNLSFQRLVQCDFDFAALDAFYAEADRAN